MLNEYEKNKFEIISKVVSKEITIKEAMDKLNLTERQIYRLKKIYIEHGENGFIHKNRGKENPNKINNNLIEELENLYLEKHFDFNFEHFYEDYVLGKYDISYDTMLKRFTKDDKLIYAEYLSQEILKAIEKLCEKFLKMSVI